MMRKIITTILIVRHPNVRLGLSFSEDVLLALFCEFDQILLWTNTIDSYAQNLSIIFVGHPIINGIFSTKLVVSIEF